MWLLTAGYCDVDAIHALATEQMQPVFEKLRSEYDFIIIDGAPVLGMSDALIFGQYSDGAILSVRRDFSQMPKINEAAALLRSVGIRLIGSVVNGVPTKSDDRVTQLRLIAPEVGAGVAIGVAGGDGRQEQSIRGQTTPTSETCITAPGCSRDPVPFSFSPAQNARA